jgi:hypothetical protein
MSDYAKSNEKPQEKDFLDKERSAGSNRGAGSVTLSRAATITAIAVLIVYVAALLLIFVDKAGGQWVRVVHLLSGYEAFGLIAVSSIFGTQVRRGVPRPAGTQTESAQADVSAGPIFRRWRGGAYTPAGLADSPRPTDRCGQSA